MSKEALRTLLSGREDPAILYCKAHAPYDGCWWEPNYWLFKEGELFPIYVSGNAYKWFGLNQELTAYDVIMHGTIADAFVEVIEENASGPYPAYDGWELEEIDEIDPNPNNLNTMTVILGNHGLDGPVWQCHYCEEHHRGVAKFLGYEGNGGVGIWLSMPTCERCFGELRWCEGCHFTVMPEDGKCPSFGCQDLDPQPPMHPLKEEEDDEAKKFGLDGSKFLAPGEACGPPPVIVIMKKMKEEADG